MLAQKIRYAALMLVAAIAFVGCSDDDSNTSLPLPTEGRYGSYAIDEEQIPVNSYTVSDGDWFLVMLTPLESTASAGTYAVIGVHPELLGQEVDVEYAYCNYDYVFVVEDPTYYHAAFRALQNGSIKIDVNGNAVSIKADVTTFDGKHFTYQNDNLVIE